MKVLLITGGRDFTDAAYVGRILSVVHRRCAFTAIRQGTARGADQLAAEWGWDHGIAVQSYPAEWEKWGKRAGFIRNQEMIDGGVRPWACIAFPGGRGTADMVSRVQRAGIPCWDLGPHYPRIPRL